MSSPPPSAAESRVPGNAPVVAVDLIARHWQLRTRLRWLLPVGAALLLLLIYQLATSPERAALMGYRYQQVGIQPDSTWWILAYRAGKAEILFSRDTAHGWQRHELGVDSSQARALALDWGGKALLVGDGGALRFYDAQFRPLDSAQYPFGRQLDGRWVAANRDGQRAVVVGDSGQLQRTVDGGASWKQVDTLDGLVSDTLRSARYYWQRACFGNNNELELASSYVYQRVYTNPKSTINQLNKSSYALVGSGGTWSIATAGVPIIYFDVSVQGIPRLLRQDGSIETGTVYYASSKEASRFPLFAKPIDAAFSPSRPGFCLIISRNQVFTGQLDGPFTSLQPEAGDSSKATPPASTRNAADSNKARLSPSAQSKTPAPRPAKTVKTSAPAKAKKTASKQTAEPRQEAPKAAPAREPARPDTTAAAAARAKIRAANAAKAEKKAPPQPSNQSPVQQTQINPANQSLPPQNQSAPGNEKY